MNAPAKISLLIVEDEALIAENVRLTLEDLGYEVLDTCYSYAQAVAAFAQYAPDLVLLDINLGSADPARDGLALAQLLSAQTAPPPFIFLTAYNDLDTIRQATRLAPSGYLIKPVNGAALFATIQTAIAHSLAHRAAPLPTASLAAGPEPPEYFFVKLGDTNHRVQWADVSCIEAGKNYVTLRTGANRLGYPIRGSLSYVLDSLLPASLHAAFIRVNRRTSLNAVFITHYDDEFVYCGDERFENSPSALKQLQERVR